MIIIFEHEYLSSLIFSMIFVAQAAPMAAWYTFGSPILMNLGFYEDEVSSSTAFGILMSMAGLIGTPLGGYLLDLIDPGGYFDSDRKHMYVYYRRQPFLHTTEEVEFGESYNEPDTRQQSDKTSYGSNKFQLSTVKYNLYLLVQRACALLYWLSLLIFLCFVLAVFTDNKGLFLFLITLAFTLCHATSASILISQSIELKHCYQGIASEISLLFLHSLGDLPATIVTGLLKNHYAPDCGLDATGRECRQESGDLRWVVFHMGLWSIGAVAFFALAWWEASDLCRHKVSEYNLERTSSKKRKRRARKKKGSDEKTIMMQRLLTTEYDH